MLKSTMIKPGKKPGSLIVSNDEKCMQHSIKHFKSFVPGEQSSYADIGSLETCGSPCVEFNKTIRLYLNS